MAVIDLICDNINLDVARRAFIDRLIDVHGRERQQADEEEIANDDENAPIHNGAARARAGSGASVRMGSTSDSSNNFRRIGRRWKILKMETNMMPKEVEE